MISFFFTILSFLLGYLVGLGLWQMRKSIRKSKMVNRSWNNFDELVDALKAWQLYDSESGDKHPCPDYTLRVDYRNKARKLTEDILKKIAEQSHG